jgi:hypothetical protein
VTRPHSITPASPALHSTPLVCQTQPLSSHPHVSPLPCIPPPPPPGDSPPACGPVAPVPPHPPVPAVPVSPVTLYWNRVLLPPLSPRNAPPPQVTAPLHAALWPLSRLTRLSRLSLSALSPARGWGTTLARLAPCCPLAHLDLAFADVADADMQALAGAHSGLTHLNLNYSRCVCFCECVCVGGGGVEGLGEGGRGGESPLEQRAAREGEKAPLGQSAAVVVHSLDVQDPSISTGTPGTMQAVAGYIETQPCTGMHAPPPTGHHFASDNSC